MKVYQVDNILFTLRHNNSKYLNTLNNYLVNNKKPEFNISVNILNGIAMPKGKIINDVNKEIITSGQRVVIYEENNNVLALIKHDHNYKNIIIDINKQTTKNIERMEYIYIGIVFLEIALYKNYLPLHGTAINVNNKTIIISAPSGTGKSTQRNFIKSLVNDSLIINDDKPILKFTDEINIYGSPFSGEDVINSNNFMKLDAILFLKQDNENGLKELTETEKISELLKNIYKPKYDMHWDLVTRQIEQLVDKIPMYYYHAKNDLSSAIMLIEKLESILDSK